MINVLSCFDGMSCLQIALNRAGIKYGKYYASEVDKYAIKVTMANYPDTIQIGDVRNVDVSALPKIDFLGGGSPCQSFSFAGKRKGMSTKGEILITSLEQYLQLKNDAFEFEGQSYLFWEYVRILKEIRQINPNVKFILENVLMEERWEKLISKTIGVNSIQINSALFSAQNRNRLYWTNLGMEPGGLFGDLESIIQLPKKDSPILMMDILQKEYDDKYYLSEKMLSYLNSNNKKQKESGNGFKYNPNIGDRKSKTITTKEGGRMDDNFIKVFIPGDKINYRVRRLTEIECERLQTVDDNYTNYVSGTQRYRMLGNGWNIDTIVHLLSYYK